MATDLHKPDPLSWLRRLSQKRDAEELTSGTLTVTIAPDPTCGFDQNGDAIYVCDEGKPCSWESGRINRFWCGWERLHTTCLDSTILSNAALCDSECRENKYNGECGSSESPFCGQVELGDGIFSYACYPSSSMGRSFDSTRTRQPRDFSTVVFVDGTSETQLITGKSKRSELEMTAADSRSTTVPAKRGLSTPTGTSSHGRDPDVGAIVGGAVGGLAVIVLGILGLLLLRRRRNNVATPPEYDSGSDPQPYIPADVPNMSQLAEAQTGAHDAKTQPHEMPDQPSGSTPQPVPSKSPPLQEAPNTETRYNYELDEGKADHHRGTIHEME